MYNVTIPRSLTYTDTHRHSQSNVKNEKNKQIAIEAKMKIHISHIINATPIYKRKRMHVDINFVAHLYLQRDRKANYKNYDQFHLIFVCVSKAKWRFLSA